MEKEKNAYVKPQIKISVRNLVEFLMQGGDLDNRRKSTSKDAMQQGGQIHRKIQKKKGSNYQAEYSLSIKVSFEDYDLVVEGRADGVLIEEDQQVTIDEIKGTYMDIGLLEEPIKVHRAQAMCYAYIYGSQQGKEQMGVQLTYCNMETEELKYFHEVISYPDLKQWFDDLMMEYKKWADYQVQWRKKRKKSIIGLEFPFAYRPGQKEFVADVYRTILRKKNLFVQAPTGVGKTISTVFPSVKAVGEDLADKIFYLTAKTITRTVAREAFQTLSKLGMEFKVLTITAKDKICLNGETTCNPVDCIYAKGHYDRINQAVYEMLQDQNSFTRESIIKGAIQYQVCPFELSLDLALWVDGIICDYNYVFDPNVKLKRFFQEGKKGDYLFLVDEAHNLVDRARNMYSATLYKEDFLEVKNAVKYHSRKLEKALSVCNHTLLEMRKECDTYSVLSDTGHFILHLLNLTTEIEKFMEIEKDGEITALVSELSLKIYHFVNMYDRLDEHYTIYVENQKDGRFCIKLFCINTAKNLQECLDMGSSTVFFSATLLPITYYKSLFSKKLDDYAIYIDSPFKKEQRGLFIGRDVSTKYTRRTIEEYEKIADYIFQVVAQKKGNYMIFFPSYKMMEDIYQIFYERSTGLSMFCVLQKMGMSEEDREEFLSAFLNQNEKKSVLAFCVLGGIFSEGIDLTGEQLIGTIIVGTGLPQISNEKDILKSYYEKRGMNGFDHAFLYPGMNKVQQAAGRVIRTMEDKGVILLLDERFLSSSYRKLFPREWEDYEICSLGDISEKVQNFWEHRKE